jgi:DNA repair protein RecO (recombination protein O)
LKLQWQQNSIVLSSRIFAENSRIVTVFSRDVGKTSGLARGIKTPIQPGDINDVLWRGRLAEQLGTFKMENIFSPFVHIFANSQKIYAMESACTLCSNGLPEKAPHPNLFDTLQSFLLSIPAENWLINYVFLEVSFLAEVGMGLDLSKCAVTGKAENLFYISPRTGHAVIREAGENYRDRLFVIPKFLISNDHRPSNSDLLEALRITGHFLKMYFYGINGAELPLSRDYLVAWLLDESIVEIGA